MDKAFVGGPCDAAARSFNYEPHVRPIGEEDKAAKRKVAGRVDDLVA